MRCAAWSSCGRLTRWRAIGSKKKPKKLGRVNWEFLEKKISASEHAFQRPIIQRKIDELVGYYLQCAETGTLPADVTVVLGADKAP